MDHSFFGLADSHSLTLYNQIFDFVFYSDGGFTFSDVYQMPISVRTLYMQRLHTILEERNAQMKKANNKRR